MTSEVGICNAALIDLGESTITALTEDTKAARLCNQRYALLRDAELRTGRWVFANKKVQLAKLASTPEFEFTSEFQLPSDSLRVIKTDNDRLKYRIEDGKLLASVDVIKIQYVRRITDPNAFDSLFSEALAAKIAERLALALTDDKGIRDRMVALYETAITEARSANAFESGTPEVFEAFEWIDSRF